MSEQLQLNTTYNLKEMRGVSKRTAESIARDMDVTTSTLFAWESGITQIPLGKLDKLLSIYNFTVQDLNWDQVFHNIRKNTKAKRK